MTEQRLCDQVSIIKKNGWLTNLELEEIKRRVLKDNICSEADEAVDHRIVDSCRDENLDASGI